MNTNFNKPITATSIRLGELRFSYVYVFAPRRNDDGTEGKYSVQLLIPKSDAQAKKLIDAAVEAAAQAGVQSKWNGKRPAPAKLHLPLRDGDEEYPDDDVYAGMWFLNAGSKTKPGIKVLEGGQMSDALDSEDFYSGCYGAAVLNFFAYDANGNKGVGAGLNVVLKTRDGDKLAGGMSADEALAGLYD